jgi:hypothetical protein
VSATEPQDMPGIKVPAPPQVVAKVEITRTSDGRIHVSWPPDRTVAFGMLLEALTVIQDHARNPGSGLVVPVRGMR